MTGEQFRNEVYAHLEVDGKRRGIAEFRAATMRAAIADLAHYIPELGPQLAYADDELTPFDEKVAEAVAEFMKSRIARNVDRNMGLSQAHYGSYLTLRRRIFIDIKGGRVPLLEFFWGKPASFVLTAKIGHIPVPLTGEVWFTVKLGAGQPDCQSVIQLKNGSGIDIIDADAGKHRVKLTATQAKLFVPGEEYRFEVQAFSDTGVPVIPSNLQGLIRSKVPVMHGDPAGGTSEGSMTYSDGTVMTYSDGTVMTYSQ